MEIKANFNDLQRLNNLISGLKDFEKDKVVKEGLRTAGKLFVNAGKTNLIGRMKNKKGVTGNLKRSMKTKVKRRKLGALAGFSLIGFSLIGRHSHLIDLGTKERKTKKGYDRGQITGNKFWTDAINSNKSNAINTVYEGISNGIKKIIERRK